MPKTHDEHAHVMHALDAIEQALRAHGDARTLTCIGDYVVGFRTGADGLLVTPYRIHAIQHAHDSHAWKVALGLSGNACTVCSNDTGAYEYIDVQTGATYCEACAHMHLDTGVCSKCLHVVPRSDLTECVTTRAGRYHWTDLTDGVDRQSVMYCVDCIARPRRLAS